VVEELGSEVHVLFGVDAPPVSSDAVRAAEESDEEGGARLIHDEAERSTFTARVSAASTVKAGDPITLTVNTSAMHAFDPATGESIGIRALASAGS
jgi:multiple sugar transport system ATP-binding protein